MRQTSLLSPLQLRRKVRRARSTRARIEQFAKASLAFLLGLAVAGWAADYAVGRHVRDKRGFHMFGQEGMNVVGWDVYEAKRRADREDAGVRTIVIGDSVCRQLFLPGREPVDPLRYLSGNQAISMAGQYYLLELALSRCPHAREVILFYYPGSLENDLGPELSHDYFCGYFHTPGQVVEMFGAKRDVSLSASQVGRCLLPNLMALNSSWHMAGPIAGSKNGPPRPGAYLPPTATREPLLEAMSDALGRPKYEPITLDPQLGPPARIVSPSPMTRHFLPKIRALCQSRGVTFRLLPVPCDRGVPYRELDTDRVYDEPIFYLDRNLYLDTVHFLPENIATARRTVVEHFKLDPSMANVAAKTRR